MSRPLTPYNTAVVLANEAEQRFTDATLEVQSALALMVLVHPTIKDAFGGNKAQIVERLEQLLDYARTHIPEDRS
jgi:hypothetical protein